MFLGLYLEALDEELVAPHTSTITHKRTFILEVGDLEEETQAGESQTEVGKRDYTVRRSYFLLLRAWHF